MKTSKEWLAEAIKRQAYTPAALEKLVEEIQNDVLESVALAIAQLRTKPKS